ncbi:hypothetical protein MFLO_04285 [Listeria floridensis FSL S10-1187]|uniref:Uncharacterized protein n=1 Tax=Listeria floridensis FSL S10-1187 TaxID=1265817 RepID=A0ABP3B1G8_9LIST|nr:DUF961 family protein [Listeria floridensis]EUJ33130.1 hypothetical protein MFLO_04285 [Listeria floridensis FSL S10-1187]
MLQDIYFKDSEFKNLEFLGRNEMEDLVEGNRQNQKTTHFCYKLMGQNQVGGLNVHVPSDVIVQAFESGTAVKLVNPVIRGMATRSQNGSIINWIVVADNIVPA